MGCGRAVFQSTPLRGAKEPRCPGSSTVPCGFNPRPCAGRKETRKAITAPSSLFQSTPLRGAKEMVILAARPSHGFQSTPLRGAKARPIAGCIRSPPCFNPRPCAGRKPGQDEIVWQTAGFNPRPCAGRKGGSVRLGIEADVSIHAPARGERQHAGVGVGLVGVFQSTPLRGAKGGLSVQCVRHEQFQSTPLRGAKAVSR